MNYVIYLVNTDEYLKGYDQSGNAVWSSKKEAKTFENRETASDEAFSLGLRGFAVIVEYKNERLKDEW